MPLICNINQLNDTPTWKVTKASFSPVISNAQELARIKEFSNHQTAQEFKWNLFFKFFSDGIVSCHLMTGCQEKKK